MNCKKDDLAIIVKSTAGNEGKIVRCISFIGKYTFNYGTHYDDVWQLDNYYPAKGGGVGSKISDSCLRPIRDSDKEDEMLRLIGKPENSKLTA